MTETESKMRRGNEEKKFLPDYCQEYEEGQGTGREGEMYGYWTEMAGSLT
jgi:hypothetical protein